MGRLPKPPEQRHHRNKRPEIGVVSVAVTEDGAREPAPPHDPEWLPETIEQWHEYWASDISGLVNKASDLSGVRRLFHYRDEHERALRAFRETRLTLGSMKQVKASPMGALMQQLEKLIVPLEDRYGLSALARLKLGAEFGNTTKSLAEMNAALAASVESEGGPDADDDEFLEADVVELPGLPKAK